MKTYIYSCVMAILCPVLITFILGGLTISSCGRSATIIDGLTGSFIFYCYLNALICLSYALKIRFGIVTGKWWMNVLLFLIVMIVLPVLIIILPIRGMDIDSAVAGGAYEVGKNLFNIGVLVVVVFIAGFFIKNRRKVKNHSAAG